MDIARLLQVVWRFRLLVASGFALATIVALYSYLSISFGGGFKVSYREDPVYLSASAVLVTQPGFPWGRAILDDVITAPSPIEGGKPQIVPRFSDPGRYSGLAALYAQLARADQIVAKVKKGSGPNEYYEAEVVRAGDGASTLPMIFIKGYGPTAEAAKNVSNRATDEFRAYLETEQDRNRIAKDKRVEVIVTQRASQAEVFAKRSFVRPMMMFLLICIGFLALAFALENLRPRGDESTAGGRRSERRPTPDKPQVVPAPDKPQVVPDPPPARERERSSAVWSR
jgi:hypothetical protein